MAGSVVSIARWWTSATQEARWALWNKAVHGDPQAPTLETLRVAVILAECEAGEVSEG